MPDLEVNDLVKDYGETRAVDHVSFTARPGRILGLLGPNGAGKTSTIRVITYIALPDGGSVTFEDRPVSAWSQERMGYLPEERGLYKNVAVGHQLVYFGRLKGLSRTAAQSAAREWLERFDAADWYDKEIDELSKGMQQKVQFIATLLHDPDLLIFDEPFSGLDPINTDLLRDIILELKEQGRIVLFASHRMEQVERLCDDICLISDGRLVLSGTLREIKQSFGRNTIDISFDGSARFIDELEQAGKVRVVERGPHHAELRLIDSTTGRMVLDAALEGTDEVTHFDLVEPSMNEIFVSTVDDASKTTEQSVSLA